MARIPCCGRLLPVVLAFVVGSIAVSCDRLPIDPSEALSWPPPVGWEEYEEIEVPAAGGVIELDPDADYRISASETITSAVQLRGGRNVVWIGGHISIDRFADHPGPTERRGLLITDSHAGPSTQGRVVHIEGVLIDGDDLSEGINIAAPSAVVQIENVRVAGVTIRGADDRDGTDGYTNGLNHADVLQPFGGFAELRVDGLTGYSNYQGLYLLQDIGTPTQGDIRIRRTNLVAIETTGEDGYAYAGHVMYRWDPVKTGQQFLDNGTVWVQHHPDSGWTDEGIHCHAHRDASGVLVPDPSPGTSRFEDNLYLPGDLHSDALGSYVSWDDTLVDGRPAIRNWLDTGKGRVYSGLPPAGDYVPAATVGLDYVSPGYVDAEPGTGLR